MGEKYEPIEMVTADIEDQHQGGVMQALGERKGDSGQHGAGRSWPCAPGIPHSGAWSDRFSPTSF
jgi:hypothetical protein